MLRRRMSITSLLNRLTGRAPAPPPPPPRVSAEYELITPGQNADGCDGWRDLSVAEAQHAAFAPIVADMRKGRLREDFSALIEAVRLCHRENPFVLEVGCGSGWNGEVLQRNLGGPLRYVGLDYSAAMAGVGQREYPGTRFIVGDAAALPLADRCCDIVLLGTVLMHLLDYRAAIAEARRVAGAWVILHTVPVLQQRKTTLMKKLAYGQPTAEVIFNESELRQIVEQSGLAIRHTLASLPYDLFEELDEHTVTKTYVCEVHS
jgi:SAM-dependent methyltransferase